MNVDFKGYGENVATFIASGTLSAGQFVKMSDNFTVAAAVEDDEILGYCVEVRNGYAAVQLSGYVEAKSSGTVNLGYVGISAKAADTIQASATAVKRQVVYSDSVNHIAGFIL